MLQVSKSHILAVWTNCRIGGKTFVIGEFIRIYMVENGALLKVLAKIWTLICIVSSECNLTVESRFAF